MHGGMNALDLEGYTMCLSADKRVHRSGLCSTAQDSLAWDDQAMGFRQQRSSLYGADKMAAHVPMPQDKEAPLMRAFSKAGGKAQLDGETWTLTPPAPAGKAGHQPLKAEFDLADEADALLLEELNLACHVASGLPDAVEDASATKSLSDRPDLFFMTVNALPHLLDEHGDDSPKAHAAMSLVDAAAREVLAGISARYDDQVAAAVLMDNSVAARPLHDEFHRFLSATNAPTMTPGYNSSVSIEQIVEVCACVRASDCVVWVWVCIHAVHLAVGVRPCHLPNRLDALDQAMLAPCLLPPETVVSTNLPTHQSANPHRSSSTTLASGPALSWCSSCSAPCAA